jgi:probable HAF family extracellular repeat protein
MVSVGTLGGPATSIFDLNDRRQVVGVSTLATGEAHAVVWDNGKLIDLGTLPGGNNSDAVAINRRGQIAGQSNSAESPQLAVLWTRH